MERFICRAMKIAIIALFLTFSNINAEKESASTNARLKRVYNGTNAPITSFPYFVAIEYRCGGFFGGGSIISSNFVLTAAHHFYYDSASDDDSSSTEIYPDNNLTNEYSNNNLTTAYIGNSSTESDSINYVDGPSLQGPSTPSTESDLSNFSDDSENNGQSTPNPEWDFSNSDNGAIIYEQSISPKDYLVRAGTSLKDKGGSLHEVNLVEIHPDYIRPNGAGGKINDIALIRVVGHFVFDQFRQPIRLFDASVSIKTGTEAIVVGMGETRNGLAWDLKNTTIWVTDRKQCENTYMDIKKVPIPKSGFCAGGGNDKRDTCNHDSGGPLVIMNMLAGITSFGNGECGIPKVPAIYTEVSQFRSWIESFVSLP